MRRFRREPCEGFGVLGAAGRFAIAVPLAETMLAGWLLSQANIASPEGMMTVAPCGPKDRITLGADGTLSGRARGVPFASDAKPYRGAGAGPGRSFDCAGRSQRLPDRAWP